MSSQAPEHPSLMSNQMKKLMELHQMAKSAMKDLRVRLWPSKPLPSSYFGLVQKLCNVASWIDVLKRLVCIEGARMAFAKTMVRWPKTKGA